MKIGGAFSTLPVSLSRSFLMFNRRTSAHDDAYIVLHGTFQERSYSAACEGRLTVRQWPYASEEGTAAVQERILD